MEVNVADANTERDPLEVLAAEYMERLRQDQSPSVEEYAAQHPSLADEIRELFPTIAVTERLKAKQERSSGGRASLGAAQPKRLGDFRLIREIGRGGMGVVFEAEQESLGRRVAVKVLPRQVLLDEKYLKRFEREARIAANLHHTNIVEVFGVGEQDGFHYYVMQYIRGVGLDVIIPLLSKRACHQASSGPQPVTTPATIPGSENGLAEAAARQLLGEEAGPRSDARLGPHYWQSVARIGWQAAAALEYAHNQGVLHRDIKPANLLLGAENTVWLADFGLAKAAQSGDVSLSRDIVGTLRYMAPERFRGQADHRSDIYSLGLTLYELLALRPAYEETDQTRLIQRIAQGPPPRPSTARLGIPRDLETIILKAISHDVGQRYSSAATMAEDLRCFLEDRPIRARRVGSLERLGRWCRRNKALATLSGTTLMLLMLVAVVASMGYLRTKKALAGVSLERSKAEANANLAIEALDRTFERLSPARMRVQPQLAVEGAAGELIEVPNSPMLSKDTAALLEEMLPFYDRLAHQTGNDGDDLRARAAEANRRVGAIRQRLGQAEESVNAYQRAATLFRELGSRSPTSSSPNLKVAQIENELGRLYASQRQATQARQAHLTALALLEAAAALPTAPADARFELARTYFFLGLRERPLPASSGDGPGPARVSEEQRDTLTKAVALLNSLSAQAPANPEYAHLLALCYLEGGRAEEVRGPEAKGGAERAIEILEGLVKTFPAIPDYAYDLSEAYTRIHIPRQPVPPELQKTVEERFGKARVLLDQLVARHPEIPDFIRAQARLEHKVGSYYRQTERLAEAERSFRNAMAEQSPLVEQFPDAPDYRLWMATFRIALADVLIRRDQASQARTELEGTISALSQQLEKEPQLDSIHGLLAMGYSRLEAACRRAGEEQLAAEAAKKADKERALSTRPP